MEDELKRIFDSYAKKNKDGRYTQEELRNFYGELESDMTLIYKKGGKRQYTPLQKDFIKQSSRASTKLRQDFDDEIKHEIVKSGKPRETIKKHIDNVEHSIRDGYFENTNTYMHDFTLTDWNPVQGIPKFFVNNTLSPYRRIADKIFQNSKNYGIPKEHIETYLTNAAKKGIKENKPFLEIVNKKLKNSEIDDVIAREKKYRSYSPTGIKKDYGDINTEYIIKSKKDKHSGKQQYLFNTIEHAEKQVKNYQKEIVKQKSQQKSLDLYDKLDIEWDENLLKTTNNILKHELHPDVPKYIPHYIKDIEEISKEAIKIQNKKASTIKNRKNINTLDYKSSWNSWEPISYFYDRSSYNNYLFKDTQNYMKRKIIQATTRLRQNLDDEIKYGIAKTGNPSHVIQDHISNISALEHNYVRNVGTFRDNIIGNQLPDNSSIKDFPSYLIDKTHYLYRNILEDIYNNKTTGIPKEHIETYLTNAAKKGIKENKPFLEIVNKKLKNPEIDDVIAREKKIQKLQSYRNKKRLWKSEY